MRNPIFSCLFGLAASVSFALSAAADPLLGGAGTTLGGPAAAVTPAPVNATVTRSGKIVLTVSIAIKSAVPTAQPIYCQLNSAHYGTSTILETLAVKATRNGSTASCTVPLNYSWRLPDANGSIANTLTVVSGQYEFGTPTVMARNHTSGLATISPIPANGATTALSASVTF